MVEAESNNGFVKGSCYLLTQLMVGPAIMMLWTHDFRQQPAQGWGYLLLIILIGVVPPLWYASTLRRYRLTLTSQELLLEQLPATVLTRRPMPSLLRWGVYRPQGRYSAGEVLYLRFRQGDTVRINAVEYEDFQQLVNFLQNQFRRQREKPPTAACGPGRPARR